MIDEAMIADLKAEGLTEDSLKKIEPLAGKKFDMAGVWAALRPILHADEVVSRKLKELDDRIRATGRPGPKLVVDTTILGYSAEGYRGQYMVVLPGRRMVAVRQIRCAEDRFGQDRRFRRVSADGPGPGAVRLRFAEGWRRSLEERGGSENPPKR